MGPIDSRVMPLIETLVAVGADWLALEVMGAIAAGRIPEDSAEILLKSRLTTRHSKAQERNSAERAIVSAPAIPIPPDEQVDWAVSYVNERISQAVAMVGVSLDNLGKILSTTSGAAERPSMSALTNPVTVALRTEEDPQIVSRAQVSAAELKLASLRDSLESWAKIARKGEGVS